MEREDEVCPQISKKMLPAAQWVGALGKKDGPPCHSDLGRKTLANPLNMVANEKQLEDRRCGRVNRTQRSVYVLGKIMSTFN